WSGRPTVVEGSINSISFNRRQGRKQRDRLGCDADAVAQGENPLLCSITGLQDQFGMICAEPQSHRYSSPVRARELSYETAQHGEFDCQIVPNASGLGESPAILRVSSRRSAAEPGQSIPLSGLSPAASAGTLP